MTKVTFLLSTAKLSEDRIPVVEVRFPAPVRAGPGTFSASRTMGDGVFFSPAVKRPGRSFHHAPRSRAEVKQRVELYIYSSGPSWPVLGWTLPLPYYISYHIYYITYIIPYIIPYISYHVSSHIISYRIIYHVISYHIIYFPSVNPYRIT